MVPKKKEVVLSTNKVKWKVSFTMTTKMSGKNIATTACYNATVGHRHRWRSAGGHVHSHDPLSSRDLEIKLVPGVKQRTIELSLFYTLPGRNQPGHTRPWGNLVALSRDLA